MTRPNFVISALIAPEQPDHDFKPDGTLAFRFDFGGFLPRHVLPALVVEYFRDIAKLSGREIIWQNGVLPRPRRHDARALVRADYHTRTIDILVKGTDAPLYLGMLRDSILATLETMPQLPFKEEVELRSDRRKTLLDRGGRGFHLDFLRNYSNGATKASSLYCRAGRYLRHGSHPGGDAGPVRFAAGRCLFILFQ